MEQINIKDIKSLLKAMEKENFDKASKIFDELVKQRESNLIEQVEEITQNLHDTLESFGTDNLILKHTKHDLPDASERLQYVMEATEEASQKTLSASENLMGLIETVESRVMDNELKQQLELAKSEVTNIMMAQTFQDLTGQVLNRVIVLVTSLEQSLQELIERSGIRLEEIDVGESDADKKAAEMKGIGPNVTQSAKNDSAQSQADVDDLLGDLGI